MLLEFRLQYSDFRFSISFFTVPNGKQSYHNEIGSQNLEVGTRKSIGSGAECNIYRSLGVFVIL